MNIFFRICSRLCQLPTEELLRIGLGLLHIGSGWVGSINLDPCTEIWTEICYVLFDISLTSSLHGESVVLLQLCTTVVGSDSFRRSHLQHYIQRVFSKCNNIYLQHSQPTETLSALRRHCLRSANRNCLTVPRCRLSIYACREFDYAGPTVWNSLSDALRNSDSFDSFEQLLKTISRY